MGGIPMSRAATLALIGLVTVLCYAPLRQVGMVYEDAVVVAKPSDHAGAFPNRWLTYQSFALTGFSPPSVHAVTLGVHLVNGVLWYLVLRTWWTAPAALAAVAVALWHPLATEAVITFTGRTDVLMTTGWLIALLGARRQQWGMALAGLLWACLSKEIGIAGVGLIAVIAWQHGHRWAPWAGGMAAALILVPVWDRWLDAPLVSHGVFAWQQLAVLGTFAQLVVVPVGLSISHDAAAMSLVMPWVALAVAVGLAGLATRGGVLAVSLALVVTPLWPRFLVYGVETISERHAYAALFGVSAVLVWGVVRLADALQGYAACTQYQPFAGWTALEDSGGT